MNKTMKSIKRLAMCSFAAVAVVSHFGVGSAAAQPAAACSCETGMVSNAGAKGSLIDVSGDVFVSGPNGYAEAKAGQSLAPNSRVIVGPKGMANLRYGQCQITAPADSTATISTQNQNVCVNVTKSYMGTAEQSTGFLAGLESTTLTPLLVGAGSLGFGFIGLGVAVADELDKASD
ncbi:MAG: hypothetical protein GY947_22285 [Rhodobacteraceae bacterium]|nr:hypothetical protein [Paracoccaceae bacterium]